MPLIWSGQALLHAWHHQATDAVQEALDDDAWQVREVAAQLVRHHKLSFSDELVELLKDDAYPHVRMAAARAVGAVATPQHDAAIQRLQQLVMDPNSMLAGDAEDAMRGLDMRLNRAD